MANPSATARQSPISAGYIWIPDGMRTKFTFSLIPNAPVFEFEVKPSGWDGGEAIEQDNVWLVAYRVFRAQQIMEATESQVRCMYDPYMRHVLKGQINVEKSGSNAQVCTEADYDGTTRAYYGFLRMIEFDNLVKGQKGQATLTIRPTNWDPINNVEVGPVMVNVTGS